MRSIRIQCCVLIFSDFGVVAFIQLFARFTHFLRILMEHIRKVVVTCRSYTHYAHICMRHRHRHTATTYAPLACDMRAERILFTDYKQVTQYVGNSLARSFARPIRIVPQILFQLLIRSTCEKQNSYGKRMHRFTEISWWGLMCAMLRKFMEDVCRRTFCNHTSWNVQYTFFVLFLVVFFCFFSKCTYIIVVLFALHLHRRSIYSNVRRRRCIVKPPDIEIFITII